MTQNKFIIVVLLILFVSCSKHPHYEKVYSFENREWKDDVKLSFPVEIEDVATEYNFTLSLRVSTDYKYNNLWVFLKTISPDGTEAREPFEINITNSDGTWIGNRTGSIVETPLMFNKRKLPIAGKYTFILEQGISSSEIDNVLDLGFKVEKVEE
ncbi:MAG: gliding motility lipoprotein GldH [Flavobacteriales bacterium]|nr:gliding motility lipoprotein GldH [Flavobacteriales bacterium]